MGPERGRMASDQNPKTTNSNTSPTWKSPSFVGEPKGFLKVVTVGGEVGVHIIGRRRKRFNPPSGRSDEQKENGGRAQRNDICPPDDAEHETLDISV